MAILHDSSAKGTIDANTSLTFAHTCTGSNLILFVGVDIASASDLVSGVTYNGVTMTRIDIQIIGGAANRTLYLYYLIAPATGANDVVISTSSGVDIRGVSASYTGAKQSAQPDAHDKGSADSTSITKALLTVADGCWMISTMNNDNGVPTAGSGVTSRQVQSPIGIGDSNADITPPQSYSST